MRLQLPVPGTTWPDVEDKTDPDLLDKTYQEDICVSNDFLQANMDPDLSAKCHETYIRYLTYARGGHYSCALLCII